MGVVLRRSPDETLRDWLHFAIDTVVLASRSESGDWAGDCRGTCGATRSRRTSSPRRDPGGPLGRGAYHGPKRNRLVFAQGYHAARNRLFQFELWRRQATGTVSEILGRRELERDIGARLL